jgi:hypothetical protein
MYLLSKFEQILCPETKISGIWLASDYCSIFSDQFEILQFEKELEEEHIEVFESILFDSYYIYNH